MLFRTIGCFLLAGTLCQAADLVRNGTPCADIVIAENASAEIRSAAQDLQLHLKKISGAELKVVTPDQAKAQVKVCVGESSCSQKAGYTLPAFKGSGYDIWVKGDCIVLTGPVTLHREKLSADEKNLPVKSQLAMLGSMNAERISPATGSLADDVGPMHAVSAFLERLGVRFYAPSATIVPQTKTITVPDGRETKEAAFSVREYQFGSVQTNHAELALWLKRLKSGSSQPRIGTLSLAQIMADCDKDHPDWIAQDKNGKPFIAHNLHGFPKYMNAGFQQECVVRLRKMFDADSKLKQVILLPPAGHGTGYDAAEFKQFYRTGVYPQSPARELTFAFASAVAQELQKTHPDRQLIWNDPAGDTLPVDEALKKAPANLLIMPSSRAAIFYAQDGKRTGYIKSIGKMASSNHAANILQREWWNEFDCEYVPRQCFWFMPGLQAVRQAQKENHFAGFLMDLPADRNAKWLASVPLMHLMVYVNSKLMWDPNLDLDALLSEYRTHWFGPAADDMKFFYTYAQAIAARPKNRNINALHDYAQMHSDDVPILFQLLGKAKEKTKPGTLYRFHIESVEKELAWMKPAFAGIKPEGKTITAKFHSCDTPCDGNLAKYKKWIAVGSPNSPNRTEMAIGAKDDENGFLFAFRCYDDNMANLKAPVLPADDPRIFDGDYLRMELCSSEYGTQTIVLNPSGSILDGSTDPVKIENLGDFLCWDPSDTKIKVNRFADRWEVELHITPQLGRVPGGVIPPWSINVQRIRRNGGKLEISSLNDSKEKKLWYQLVCEQIKSDGYDMFPTRVLPGFKEENVYVIHKAKGPVDISADWTKPCWKDIPEIRLGCDFHRYGRTVNDPMPDVRVRLQHDGNNIYVSYLVKDQYTKAEFLQDQDSVCLDSCVEFFIRPNGEGAYFNFETNCIGTMLLWQNVPKGCAGSSEPLTPEELKTVKRFHTYPHKPIPEIQTPNTWRMALQIPLDIFVRRAGVTLPVSGQIWTGNIFRCADTTSHPLWLMWKKASAYHVPDEFGTFIFE